MKKTIILEKNHHHRDYLRSIFSNEGDLVFCFEEEMICLDNLFQLNPDLIVVGSLLQNNVINFINGLKAIECNLPVLLLSEKPGIRRYLEVNRFNNISTLTSGLDMKKLKKAVKTAAQRKKKLAAGNNIPFFVGGSPLVAEIKKCLPVLSKSKENILIFGEVGTGRELLTRAIHFNSNNDGLFIKIDGTSIPDVGGSLHLFDLLPKRLKEIKKGTEIDGRQNIATLYIKEVGYLPDYLQGELLLISEKEPSHDDTVDSVRYPDFRIIATSSHDIDSLVNHGFFRKDLFYRLNTLDIHIPPLRQRLEDIPLLIDYLTYKFCREYDKSYFEISSDIKDNLVNYHWPGNVKELESTVKRLILNGNDKKVVERFSGKYQKSEFRNSEMWFANVPRIDEMVDVDEYLDRIEDLTLKDICWEFMARIEKKIMKKALDYTNWNRKKAASILNISYKSMLNKIKEYGLA